MTDPDQILTEIKKSRFSESNLRQSKTETTAGETTDSSDKRTVSCVNLNRKVEKCKSSSGESEVTSKRPYGSPVVCHLCGEHFDYR